MEKAAIFQDASYQYVNGGNTACVLTWPCWYGVNEEKGGAACLERKLKALFDFQKYEQNADLQKVIDRVHVRYNSKAQLLDDDDVEFVNAAGVQDTGMKKKSLLKNDDERS